MLEVYVEREERSNCCVPLPPPAPSFLMKEGEQADFQTSSVCSAMSTVKHPENVRLESYSFLYLFSFAVKCVLMINSIEFYRFLVNEGHPFRYCE